MKHIALALAFVAAGSLTWEPHTLTVEWSDGTSERMAATNPAVCDTAMAAILRGWVMADDGRRVAAVTCAPGNIFPAGHGCIAGRCDGGRR